eukprot:TRINITY_DN27936_c0_g1_i1.p1 TRINITY_DN27936_c0_g1~~TRINITY_DN27936_c0_g1_i1.p1  ORF type:complete len:199 (+),score=39.80 TRINITY_DN27936_c0_g1_i1:133-729(+)
MLPRSRSERFAIKGKDALEKERLRHRSGGFFRYEDIRNPIDVHTGSPSYIAPRERMMAGNRCEEVNYAERQHKLLHRDDVTEVKRNRQLQREEFRWRSIANQEMAAADQQRAERLQRDPLQGRKNVAGQPYDIVNHAYERTPSGAQLEHHDDMIRWRSKVREASLGIRNNVGFNPIVGEQTFGVSLPRPPRPPSLALL